MILRPVRPADLEDAGRVDVPDGVLVGEALGQDFQDIGFDDLGDLFRTQPLGVLGRQDDGGGALGFAILVFDRHLALDVGLQLRAARAADVGQAFQDVVAVLQGRRHQLRRLVRRIAEHDALVAGALVLFIGRVDADGDVGRLGVQVAGVFRGFPVEAVLLVADVLDRGADQRLQAVDDGLGEGLVLFLGVARLGRADLAGQDDPLGRDQGLARHAGLGILRQEGVDDSIRDTVGDLVGVALGDAFRGEEEGRTSGQKRLLSMSARQTYKDMLICSSDLPVFGSQEPRRVWSCR